MNLTEQQISQFNIAYENGCDKIKGIIILDSYRPRKLGFFEKLRANKAIKYFEEALEIAPEHFQSLFLLGKIFQSLEEYNKSLYYLEKAMEYEKENHVILLEASLVSMYLNLIDKGIDYSAQGLKIEPNDISLLGNHATNLLIAGKDIEAKETIEKALEIDPTDKINQTIKNKIISVINGSTSRPVFRDLIK